MIEANTAYESDEAVSLRAQRELTDKVAVRLVRKSRSRNLKLGTWAGWLGIGRHDRSDEPVA